VAAGLPVEAEVPPGLNVAGALALLSVWLPFLLLGALPPHACLLLGLGLYTASAASASISIYETVCLLSELGVASRRDAARLAAKAAILTPVTLALTIYELLFTAMGKLRRRVEELSGCLDVDLVDEFRKVREPQPLDLMMVFVTFGLHTALYAAKAQKVFRYIVYVAREVEACSVKTPPQ